MEHHDKIIAGTAMGGPPVSDEIISDVRRLRIMLKDWVDGGPLSPEVAPMADRLISSWAGDSWRDSLDE